MLLAGAAVKLIYQKALTFPLINLEDVFLGLVIKNLDNVYLKNDQRFNDQLPLLSTNACLYRFVY